MFTNNPIDPTSTSRDVDDVNKKKEELLKKMTYPVRYGDYSQDLQETLRNINAYEQAREEERELQLLNELASLPPPPQNQPSSKRRRYNLPDDTYNASFYVPFSGQEPPQSLYVPFSNYVPAEVPQVSEEVRKIFPTLFN